MPSKSLKITWLLLNVTLLGSGAFLIAFSIIWRAPNALMNFIISGMDLNGQIVLERFKNNDLTLVHLAGLALGIMFVVTWMISIGGILQRFHNTMGLIITNWALIADAIGVLSVGGTVWFYTLREKSNFLQQWEQASPQLRQGLQDQVRRVVHGNACLH